MSKRVYDVVRTMVEDHGGRMWFERKGFPPGGAWIIKYKEWQKSYPTSGQRFIGIDDLKVRKKQIPETWNDFYDELIPNVWEVLLQDFKRT